MQQNINENNILEMNDNNDSETTRSIYDIPPPTTTSVKW